MKQSEIHVGRVYKAKVSNKIVDVRVDAIEEVTKSVSAPRGIHRQHRTVKVYHVTNLNTGRTTTFKSAAKFRSEVKQEDAKYKCPHCRKVSKESTLAANMTKPYSCSCGHYMQKIVEVKKAGGELNH